MYNDIENVIAFYYAQNQRDLNAFRLIHTTQIITNELKLNLILIFVVGTVHANITIYV